MARQIRSSQLESRSQRLRLKPRWKPYTVVIAPGIRLALRRNKKIAGSWSVIVADGAGGSWMKSFASADDFEAANAETILSYRQAVERALVLARGGQGATSSDAPSTVGDALAAYEADLAIRGGQRANVLRVRGHISDAMAQKAIVLLTVQELQKWRNALATIVTASTVNRLCNIFRAALNLAADNDPRIVSRRAWQIGLRGIPDATQARNVTLPPEAIASIVGEAYAISEELGDLVHTAASTGSRVGQLKRLRVEDLQGDRSDPRLLVPVSKKGRGRKKVAFTPVAIPTQLAARLRLLAKGRPGNAPLLTREDGAPWGRGDHARPFKRAVQAAGLDPQIVTIAALRHSSITRQLIGGVPTRLAAAAHDTSSAMIEKTYSKHIATVGDQLVRATLPDFAVEGQVIRLPQTPRR